VMDYRKRRAHNRLLDTADALDVTGLTGANRSVVC
jgi:hypothetical protein